MVNKLTFTSTAETAYIGLGSNLDAPKQQLEQALKELARLPQTQLLKVSGFYTTAPVGGPPAQPDYVNAVAALSTRLLPLPLLDALQAIERAQGRNRATEIRWAPRTLDLDLLLWGEVEMTSPRLTLPHPRMTTRAFVLDPLSEIAPWLISWVPVGPQQSP